MVSSMLPYATGLANTPQRLTTHPALDYQPTVSTEAQSLAFVSTRSGNPDIWLQSLDRSGLTLPRQITADTATDHHPALNRDGTQLLYVSHKSDPRGDVYLLDLITQEEIRLTDRTSSDSFPQWDPQETAFYYLKENPGEKASSVYRKSLSGQTEELVIPHATSFSIKNRRLVYTDGSDLKILNLENSQTAMWPLSPTTLDLWPTTSPHTEPNATQRFFFVRYERDSNHDGVVDTDDESSIWMYNWDLKNEQPTSLFRLTPTHQFHAYPTASKNFLYFSDLKVGDIFRIEIPTFLQDYASFEHARALASSHQDTGRPELALLVLTNISQNLLGDVSLKERAEFDFSVAETLAQDGDFLGAQDTLASHSQQPGQIGALAKIHKIVFHAQAQARTLSSARQRRVVHHAVAALNEIGEQHRQWPEVYGQALIGAGHLHLFAHDPLKALDYLLRVDDLPSNTVRAKGLFTRGEAYRILGDTPKVIRVFIHVLELFSEQTPWGTRAIQQVIDLVQEGKQPKDQITSLNGLMTQYPKFPILTATTKLQIAELYYQRGEQLSALETLESIISTPALPHSLVIQAYQSKATILSESERYQEAAETYASLSQLSGDDETLLKEIQSLLVSQRVRHALKDRNLGEPRIAAKSLRRLINDYPRSVEAHRAYIETKVILKEIDAVQAFYQNLVKANPNHAVYQYSHALALSYSDPSDLTLVIDRLHRAKERDPAIGYIHQTLGWAYEQYERVAGKSGYLEKAEQEYRIALEMNDAHRYPEVESQLLLNLGNTYLALSNYREAYRHYRQRELQFTPTEKNTTELLYRKNYGESAFKAGRNQESITQYRLALGLLEEDQDALKAQLLERLGLSYQDNEQYAEAIAAFTEAMELNQELGQPHNVTLLQRNIGINLFNLSHASQTGDRENLKKALDSYFTSLDRITQTGTDKLPTGSGLINVNVAVGENRSQAATGFDHVGEQKLMFSYIANTYKQLQEPGPAYTFYEKKLSLLNDIPPENQDAGWLTEKAVVLNQLGVLSYQLHQPDQARGFFRQSLNDSRTLNIPYGISVNIHNLSKLLVEDLLTGNQPDQGLVENIISSLRDLELIEYEDRHVFFTLTNAAFLLSWLPERPLEKHLDLSETVRRLHDQFHYQTLPWSYYQRAESLLRNPGLFSEEEQRTARVLIKLNQAELSKGTFDRDVSREIQDELAALVDTQPVTNGWLWLLSQAERTTDSVTRRTFLEQAAQEFLRFPVQTEHQDDLSDIGPAHDRLSRLLVDQYIEDGQPEKAFVVSEQLRVRQLSLTLYESLGKDFFLRGLDSYQSELNNLLAQLRHARSQGDNATVETLTPHMQNTLYALSEEYPWAAASYWAYPLTTDMFSLVLDIQHPYLKILKGTHDYHGFVHDGHTLHYSALRLRNDTLTGNELFHRRLTQAVSAYVSVPEELANTLSSLSLTKKPLTWVSHCYDFLNGYHQRSLFFSKISSPLQFTPTLPSTTGKIPFSHTSFTGTPANDGSIASTSDVAVFLETPKTFRFEVEKTRDVREFVSVMDFAGEQHHSVLLLGKPLSSASSQEALVESLLRAGFPHVIMSQEPLSKDIASQFVTQYLTRLNELPPDEAVVLASQDVWGHDALNHHIRHYGFAGMGPDERLEYAASRYEDEVTHAITAFEKQDFPASLRHGEHALALIDHAQQRQDFPELLTLAMESAFELQDYHKAIVYQERLLASFTSDAPVSERAEATYQLGILYSQVESFDEAVNHLEQAIQLWQGEEELDRLAEGIATLGVIRENMGSYNNALERFRESSSLYNELGEPGATAVQYRRIGRIYYLRLGRYEKARENFLAGLRIYRHQNNRKGQAEILQEIGLTYEKVGLFDHARERYEQAQHLAEDLNNTFLLATGELYLANTAWFQGDYQSAFQRLSRAKHHAEQVQDPQLQIMVSNTRGLIYWTLNETDKGLLHLQEAVKLSEASGIQTELASSLNNLGLIYRQRGEQETALKYFHRAKVIDESLNSQWGLGYDHRNIGMALLALEHLTEAEDHFLEAERLSRDIHNVTNWVKALLELGNVNHALDRTEQAMSYYEQAHTLAQRYGIREVEWRAAAGQATIFRQQENLHEALTWYRHGIEVVEDMRATLKIDELRNGFQINKLDLYRDTITLLIGMNRTDEAFNYLERSRSRSFIDLLGNQKLSFKNQGDQETWTRINALASTIESLRSELGSYDNPPTDLQKQYQRTQIAYEEAILEVKQHNPALSSFVVVDPLNLEDVQKLLAPKVGLLSYFMTKGQLYLWLITQEQTVFKSISVKEERLASLVKRYRQLVQHIEPVDDELQQLYEYLIKPIALNLKDLDFLGIIPDESLHFLSFAALKHGPAYLIDDIPLFYAPSASVFRFTFAKRQTQKNDKVLAIGNPDLGSFNYDLPLAELEANSIKWNYPQMDILTGPKATKEWVVKNISQYGIIHLAAHGEFDELNPLLSSLWLASTNPENRRLTVKEVFSLELNADLVTLSACQTGLGKLEAGELIGLNRAFIYAGTHALVSALWRVDDLSTSVLMKHFYRNYVAANKATSLRQAQLIVKKDFPHPSYWAGFSLIGDYQ